MNDTHSGLSRREFLKINGTIAIGAALITPGIGQLLADTPVSKQSAFSLFQEISGLDKATIDRLISIAVSKGGEYADIFADYSVNNSIRLEDRIIKSASKSIAAGVGIRVLKGDQTGYAYSEDLNFES
ncbi:MAG TPA: DNA gyrase modulator, partial [Bacteroidota bacterium]|nr:DNA gyrase modulator [Bacteroidota bacterium]